MIERSWSDIILTNHAAQRADQRGISQSAIENTLNDPDSRKPGKETGTTSFAKKVNDRKVRVVATYLKDEKKWLVVSVWVRGEDDKLPFVWQIIRFPFWLVWKITYTIVFLIFKNLKKSRLG